MWLLLLILLAQTDAETWQKRGLILHLENKFDQAIPAFEQAVQADPKLWPSHLFLGIALYKTNRFPEALASLDRAATLQPDQPEIIFWQGSTNLALRRYPEGLRLLEQRLARDPRNPEVLQLLASAYREYGLALWNGVAEHHFDTAPGQVVHAYVLESQGALDDALAAYRKALALEPARPGVYTAIAEILTRQGKPDEANRALGREPR